jgi:hypothetical protein
VIAARPEQAPAALKHADTRYAPNRPHLHAISRHALTAASPAPAVIPEPDEPGGSHCGPGPPADEREAAENALWLALCMAPEDGYEITELIRLTKMTRATLYRRLREHARQGHAIQVSRGRWRANGDAIPARPAEDPATPDADVHSLASHYEMQLMKDLRDSAERHVH